MKYSENIDGVCPWKVVVVREQQCYIVLREYNDVQSAFPINH